MSLSVRIHLNQSETTFNKKIVEFIEETCDKFFGIQNDDWE